MGFDIGRAFGQGIRRSLTTTGFAIGVLFFVIQSATTALSQTPVLFKSTLRTGDQTTFGIFVEATVRLREELDFDVRTE